MFPGPVDPLPLESGQYFLTELNVDEHEHCHQNGYVNSLRQRAQFSPEEPKCPLSVHRQIRLSIIRFVV